MDYRAQRRAGARRSDVEARNRVHADARDQRYCNRAEANGSGNGNGNADDHRHTNVHDDTRRWSTVAHGYANA